MVFPIRIEDVDGEDQEEFLKDIGEYKEPKPPKKAETPKQRFWREIKAFDETTPFCHCGEYRTRMNKVKASYWGNRITVAFFCPVCRNVKLGPGIGTHPVVED